LKQLEKKKRKQESRQSLKLLRLLSMLLIEEQGFQPIEQTAQAESERLLEQEPLVDF
jgi:hypothetical protein